MRISKNGSYVYAVKELEYDQVQKMNKELD